MTGIILASSSPRRQELLQQLKIPFTIKVVPVDENTAGGQPAAKIVEKLAARKARAVAGELDSGIVIGADTVVTLDEQVLGKPRDREEALQMLNNLQGRAHVVYTGLALVDAASEKSIVSYQGTTVYFRSATRQELEAYVRTGEPMDKAGAYGVQGLGAVFVTAVKGCYYNVVGLPVFRLVEMLNEFGLDITTLWE